MARGRKKQVIDSAFLTMGDNAAGDFKGFCSELDKLDEAIKELNSRKKDIFNKAKSNGYNTVPFKEVLKLRKMKEATRLAFTQEVDSMKKALGMMDLFEYANSKDAEGSATESEADGLAA